MKKQNDKKMKKSYHDYFSLGSVSFVSYSTRNFLIPTQSQLLKNIMTT